MRVEGVLSSLSASAEESYLHCTLYESAAEVRKVRTESAVLYCCNTENEREARSMGGRPWTATAKIRECLAV